MASKRSNRTTIVIAPEVRDGLKHIARKDQSYNALLIDLIKLHNNHVERLVQKGNADQTYPLANQNTDDIQDFTSPSQSSEEFESR
jgi:hypothetical protein